MLSEEEDIRRMQVWMQAWTATAQSDSCHHAYTATKYADECLKEFDVRFKDNSNE